MRSRHSILRAFVGVVIAGLAVWTIAVPVNARQIRAGALATWKNLETWTQYHDDTRETEKGIGLILSGSGGQMRLSFSARLAGRFPNKPPASVFLEAAADPMANPNTLRSQTLQFMITSPDDKHSALDLSTRMVVDNPAAGAMLNDAVAKLKPEEFGSIAWAKAVKANIFMVNVEFVPEQLRALQKYADSLFLKQS